MAAWWVPAVPDLGLVCASGARRSRRQGERQARLLGRVYRKVDLVRFDSGRALRAKAGRTVLKLRDGKVAR